MANHLQLFDKFAKLVTQFSPDMERENATKFAELTSFSYASKPSSFANCESNTWNLLSLAATAKNLSKQTYTSFLKRWVAGIPQDQKLLEPETTPNDSNSQETQQAPKTQRKIKQVYELVSSAGEIIRYYAVNRRHQPMVGDIANIFGTQNVEKKSEVVQQPDVPVQQDMPVKLGKRRRSIVENELSRKKGMVQVFDVIEPVSQKSTLFIEQLKRLRDNDLTPIDDTLANRENHCRMYNKYCEYQTGALGRALIPGTARNARTIWKRAVKNELENNCRDVCKRALYEAMAGNENYLKKNVCNTWEDIMWTHLNMKLEDMLDEPQAHRNRPILSADAVSAALGKDNDLTSDDPRPIFHQIQTAIITGTTEELFEKIYLTLYRKDCSHLLKISENETFRLHLLRFLSTLILYGTHYLGWTESKYSSALLNAYSDLNSRPDSLRANVVAAYASKRSVVRQKHMYSYLLQNFTGDEEQCKKIIEIGKEYKLDMSDILNHTFIQLCIRNHAKRNDETDGFINALKWVLYDTDMADSAMKCAKILVDYSKRYSKPRIMIDVYEIMPESQKLDIANLKRETTFSSEFQKPKEENAKLKLQTELANNRIKSQLKKQASKQEDKDYDEPESKASLKRKGSSSAQLSPPPTPEAISKNNVTMKKQAIVVGTPVHPKKKRMVKLTKSTIDTLSLSPWSPIDNVNGPQSQHNPTMTSCASTTSHNIA